MSPYMPVRPVNNTGSTGSAARQATANTKPSDTHSAFSRPSGFIQTQSRVAPTSKQEANRDLRRDARSNHVPTGPRRNTNFAHEERKPSLPKVASNKRYHSDSDGGEEPWKKPRADASMITTPVKKPRAKQNENKDALEQQGNTWRKDHETLECHDETLKSLTEQIKTHDSSIAALNRQDTSFSSLEQAQTLNTTKIEEMDKEIKVLSGQVDQQEKTISAFKEDQGKRIDEQLQSLTEIKGKLKEPISIKDQAPFQALEGQVKHHTEMFKWYKTSYREPNDKRMDRIEAALSSSQQDHDCLKQTCQDFGSRMGIVEAVVQGLGEFGAGQKVRVDSLEEKKAQSDTTMEKLFRRIENLEKQRTQPDLEVQRLYTRLDERLKTMQKENQDLRAQNESMKNKIQKLEWRLEEQEKGRKDNLDAICDNAATWKRELKEVKELYNDTIEKTTAQCKESTQVEIVHLQNEINQRYSSAEDKLRKDAEIIVEQKMKTVSSGLRKELETSMTSNQEAQATTIQNLRNEFTQKHDRIASKFSTHIRTEEVFDRYVTKEEYEDTITKLKFNIEKVVEGQEKFGSTHAQKAGSILPCPKPKPRDNALSKTSKDVRLVVEDQQVSLDEHDASIKFLQKRLERFPDPRKTMLELRQLVTSEVKKVQGTQTIPLGPAFVPQMPAAGDVARQINTTAYPHRGLQNFTNPTNSALTAVPGLRIESSIQQRPAPPETPPQSPAYWQDAYRNVRTDPVRVGIVLCSVHSRVEYNNDPSYGYLGCWECNQAQMSGNNEANLTGN